MSPNLKLLVKRNTVLLSLYNNLLRILRSHHEIYIKSRQSMPLSDYVGLAQPLDYYPYTAIKENNLYGNGRAILPSLDVSGSQEKYYKIEHGLILGSLVPEDSYAGFHKHIITFSEYRKNFLSETNKNIICIGPYIQYANYLLPPEDFLRLKKTLGKVLLIFPSHSIDAMHVSYDIDEFTNYIETIRHDFDTVVVCMYWKDILLGQHLQYQKRGYEIVTAGHIYDYNFLPRLKTIIELADVTLSNKVGTHIGYCISMNKPHIIYLSKIKLQYFNQAEKDSRQDAQWSSYYEACDEIHKYFCTNVQSISSQQLACIKKYWGNTLKYTYN